MHQTLHELPSRTYKDYMKELKAEREYLKAIERNVHSQPNRNQIYERLINETKNKH